MTFQDNLKKIYLIFPYLKIIKNKKYLLLSFILNRKKLHIILKNGLNITLKISEFPTLLDLLKVVTYATSTNVHSEKLIELSFDTKNTIKINFENISNENIRLLELLREGIENGASFITKNGFQIKDTTIKINDIDNRKIVETSDGIKFFLDSSTPYILIETFIRKIHEVNTEDDWKNKIVVDVGAECGDTALYFANKGATVYAFEPIKAHFDSMIENIKLNPRLSEKISPVNAGIGKDGILKFYHSDKADIAWSASFVYNTHGENARISEIQGYSLESALKKFDLTHVDLLKMDCKGCEFFLTEKSLEKINTIQIQYWAKDDHSKLNNLLSVLKKSNFEYAIIRQNSTYASNSESATLYAKKQKLMNS